MSDVKAEIKKADARFSEAFKKGNAAEVAAAYTEGATLLPPNSPTVEGTKAITEFWHTVMDMGIKDVKLESVEVEAHGETAIEVGQYTLFVQGSVEVDNGKYLVVWKHDRGTWKLHRDIWNSSKPAK